MDRCLPELEGLTLASNAQDSKQSGKSRKSRSARQSSKLGSGTRKSSPTSKRAAGGISAPSISSPQESRARTSASPASAPGSRGSVRASFTTLRESCANFDPLGSFSKMFPDFSVRTKAETLRKSTAFSWLNADMGYRGVVLTASFSESPNAASVCSLLDVLESHVPQRFFLSPRAAAGIVRRAAKRNRALPMHLRRALEALSLAADARGKIPSSQAAWTPTPMRIAKLNTPDLSKPPCGILDAAEPATMKLRSEERRGGKEGRS